MPQIFNLPDRIPEGNYRESELLNRGLMQNVMDTRQRLVKRNQRAAVIKDAMKQNPGMFGKGGAQLDTFGNEDIDLNKARYQDDSYLGGQSTQTFKNEVLNPLPEWLSKSDNSDAAINNIYAKQADVLGKTMPNTNNSSTPATLGLLGSKPTGVSSTLQNNLIGQGIQNQQQIMGQNQLIGQGTVLKPDVSSQLLGNQPQPQLPLGSSVGVKNSQNQGASSGHSENYSLKASDKGFNHESALVSTKRTDNRVNVFDPVKKNMDDLNTRALLGSTNFNGAVAPQNNFAMGIRNEKVDYMKELNKALATEGITEEQKVEKLKTEDKGRDASIRLGYRDNSSVNIGDVGSAYSSVKPSGGGSKDNRPTGIVQTKNGQQQRYKINADGFVESESGGLSRSYSTNPKYQFKNSVGDSIHVQIAEQVKTDFGDYYKIDKNTGKIVDTGTGKTPFNYWVTLVSGDPKKNTAVWELDYKVNNGQATQKNMLDFGLGSVERVNNSSSNLGQMTITEPMILEKGNFGIK